MLSHIYDGLGSLSIRYTQHHPSYTAFSCTLGAVRVQDTLAAVFGFVSSLMTHNEKAHIYVRANSARYNEDGALTVSHPVLTYSDSPSLLVSELFLAYDNPE